MIDPTLFEGNSHQRLLSRMKREADRSRVVARRVHLIVTIDRLLARLLASAPAGSFVIKGGFANQLRRSVDARFTEDIDLRISATIDTAPVLIANALTTDLNDLFSFELTGEPAPLEGPPGGGLRFTTQARVVGNPLVIFKIDISASDVIVEDIEYHLSDPVLAAIGYPRSRFPVYPVTQSIAEKIHALTLPRDYENSRFRDLADLVWFTERFSVKSGPLIDACSATFAVRDDHPWPPQLPVAPDTWQRPYARLRAEVSLAPPTTEAAMAAVAKFFEPIFAGTRDLAWDPSTSAWS